MLYHFSPVAGTEVAVGFVAVYSPFEVVLSLLCLVRTLKLPLLDLAI